MKWRRRKQQEEDLDRELRSDLELEAAEQEERGLSPEEAQYAAKRALGNAGSIKEEVRDAWGWSSLDRIRQMSLQSFTRFGSTLRMLHDSLPAQSIPAPGWDGGNVTSRAVLGRFNSMLRDIRF